MIDRAADCHLQFSDLLCVQQVIEAPGAPIHRKGSGLAQLAKFLQNAQRIRSPDGKQPNAAEQGVPGPSRQTADATTEPSASSIAK